MIKFLWDFDSVIADTQQMRLNALNAEFGTLYTRDDFVSWKDDHLFPKEHLDFMWGPRCFLNPDLHLHVEPHEHAIEGIEILRQLGHTGIVVSDRPMLLYEVTLAWLKKHGLEDVQVIFTKSAAMTNIVGDASQTKSQIAYLYKLTHAIEDSPHHAEALSSREYIEMVYLMDMPYNKAIPMNDKIVRVYTIKDVAELVKE